LHNGGPTNILKIEPANLIATFTLGMHEDSTNDNNIRKATFLLLIGTNASEFVHLYNYMNDTAIRRFTTADQVISYLADPNAIHPNVLYYIYKNYPKGKLTFTDYIPSETYRYEEQLDIFHWQLTGDTATVCGYKSQKATCDFGGRSWVAWFAPELPYSDGPYKFNGLPGLIVKVGDTRDHYVFELLSLNKHAPGVMIEMEDKDYVKTTKFGFFKAWDSFRADIVNRAKQYSKENDSQQVLARNVAKDNNPIELLRK
jgi:GLPGLI family protein